MTTSITLAELTSAVPIDLGRSSWTTVDQARIDTFAQATGDHQWIHVDRERAAAGPFGTTIAHGYLTLSLISGFVFELLEVVDASAVINYGLDRVRFPSPVPVGSRVRAHGEIVRAEPVGDSIQVHTRLALEIEGRTKPACVADVLSRFR
ncbi:MaoC family dehydratase [Jiangella anatolica]|uniref:Dehydratase n=1 Tax=Jiangella anatolica TaxID=2670374 RepID=A0A2W2BPS1_9ACTN|nr:MaoC family dehydratase [Jiangella anatolica]PZF82344.1 dehydratase [Jiangella anatolica]